MPDWNNSMLCGRLPSQERGEKPDYLRIQGQGFFEGSESIHIFWTKAAILKNY
jgi:hypothetical protein